MYLRFAATLAVAALMSGCAIHPLPEDVTGLDTASIVKQIRCETRDAARKVILDYLKFLAVQRESQTAQKLVDLYSRDENLMVDFDPNSSFPGDIYRYPRHVFNTINSGAVAYTFELTMSEINNLGSSVDFFGAWQAPFNMGLTGNADRTRQNVRTFTITDKFRFLLKELNTPMRGTGRQYCDGHVALGPNYIYPIAGKIGMYKTVYDFFTMSLFENLAGKDEKPGVFGAPVMGEDLTFTTQVDLLATPRVTFTPVRSGFQVTDASVTGKLVRRDVHQVTVGLALEPSGVVAISALRGFVFSGVDGRGGVQVAFGRPGDQTLVLNRITATATSRAERLALLTIDQIKSRELTLKPP